MRFEPDPALADVFRPVVDERYPLPIAAVYREVFDLRTAPDRRQVALPFCAYQLVRSATLPLVSRYLRATVPAEAGAARSHERVRDAIAATRSPSFGTWLDLCDTFAKRLPKLLPPSDLLDRFVAATEALATPGPCWFDNRKEFHPPGPDGAHSLVARPLDALRHYRNALAHGGLSSRPDELVRLHLPILDRALGAFSYLADCRLVVRDQARLLLLQGAGEGVELVAATLDDDAQEELEEAGVVLLGPDGTVEPIYPLFRARIDRDHVLEYDGHFFDERKRHAVLYLGAHEHHSDPSAGTRLLALLERHRIEWRARRQHVTPATLADPFHDHTLRVVDELQASGRYVPSCYVPPAPLLALLDAFVDRPASAGVGDRPNGLLLAAPAGSGKTALLTHWVAERVRRAEGVGLDRTEAVLFLRGDLVSDRATLAHPPLARTILERAQVRLDEFAGLEAFLAHLDAQAGATPEAMRVVFVLDAMNEAARATDVVREALDLVREAARYPWCRVVVALRAEFLHVLRARLDGLEAWSLDVLRGLFFAPEAREGLPAIFVPPLDETQAAQVYERHRRARALAAAEGAPRAVPACDTPWDRLPVDTRRLLQTPLMLRLFLECFDGLAAEPVAEPRALFKHLARRTLERRPGLADAVRRVLARLEARAAKEGRPYLSDDDAGAIRAEWARERSDHECRSQFWPVEALLAEGWLVRAQGGGFRFVFERLLEYLLSRSVEEGLPPGGDAVAHWRAFLAGPGATYPTGLQRLTFLLTDWLGAGRYADLDALLDGEAATTVLRGLLGEAGRAPHPKGEPSTRVADVARYLERTAQACVLDTASQVAAELEEVGEKTHAITLLEALARALDARGPLGSSTLGQLLARLGALLPTVSRHADALRTLERASDMLRAELLRASPEGRRSLLLALGRALPKLGLARIRGGQARVVARACHEEASQLLEPLAAGGDREAVEALVDVLVSLADRVRLAHDYEGAERLLLQAEASLDRAPADEQAVSPRGTVLRMLAIIRKELSRFGDALATTDRALALLRPHVERRPERRHWLYLLTNALVHRGSVLEALARHDEGQADLREAITRMAGFLASHPEDAILRNRLAQAHKTLAQLLRTHGRGRQALAEATAAVRLREELADSDGRPSFRVDLAHTLLEQGRLLRTLGRHTEARVALSRSVSIFRGEEDTPELQSRAVSLGSALVERAELHEEHGRLVVAEVDLEHAIRILEPAWHRQPTHQWTTLALAKALVRRAAVLRASRRFADAVITIHRALSVLEAVVREREDTSLEATIALAQALTDAGQLWGRSWHSTAAEAALRRAVNFLEPRVGPDPRAFPDATVALAGAYRWLGLTLLEQSRVADADQALRRGLRVATAAVDVDPDRPAPRRTLAGLRLSLGALSTREGQPAAALEWFTSAIAGLDPLTARFPELPGLRDQLARALTDAAEPAAALGQRERAERHLREALALREALCREHPERDDWQNNLTRSRGRFGHFLLESGQPAAALVELERALASRRELWAVAPANLERRRSLAKVLLDLGRCHEALRATEAAEGALREAVEHIDALLEQRPDRHDWRGFQVEALEALAGLLLGSGRAQDGAAIRRRAETAAAAAADALPGRGESTEAWV